MENIIWKQWCGVQIAWSVKVWAKWQIVIPNDIRKDLWIDSWDTLLIGTKHGKLVWMIKPEDIWEFTENMKEEIENEENLKEAASKRVDNFKKSLENVDIEN